jgi:predicted dehydrogenase
MKGAKKTRVGVVGAGYLGSLHALKYSQMEGVELVGVVDTDLARAEETAGRLKTRAYASHDALFGRVDAVSVATPTESHSSVGLAFLSRGVHVMMEKPIAATIAEAERLIAEAERGGAILQVGHLERFNAAVAALDGRVRGPVFIEAERLSPFPNRGVDVDVILDLMIHDIDIILSLVASDVERVEAVGIPVVSSRADMANARLCFGNGCVADVTASRVAAARVRRMTLYQPGECISVDYANQGLSISRPVEAGRGQPGMASEDIGIEKVDSLKEELGSFLACSATGTAPVVSGRDGLKALKVARMIQEAAEASMSMFLARGGASNRD